MPEPPPGGRASRGWPRPVRGDWPTGAKCRIKAHTRHTSLAGNGEARCRIRCSIAQPGALMRNFVAFLIGSLVVASQPSAAQLQLDALLDVRLPSAPLAVDHGHAL